MADLRLNLPSRDMADIRAIARMEAGRLGLAQPVSDTEMACALLQAYLILIRDCGGVLPSDLPAPVSAPDAGPERITGKGGVSLSGGINAAP